MSWDEQWCIVSVWNSPNNPHWLIVGLSCIYLSLPYSLGFTDVSHRVDARVLLNTEQGMDAWYFTDYSKQDGCAMSYSPLCTGLRCNILLPTLHRVDVQCLTDHWTQAECIIYYWPLSTVWMWEVLLTTLHRVDAQHLTDHWAQGWCMKSYWTLSTGWMPDVLLTTKHRVDARCLTDHWAQSGCTTFLLTTEDRVDAWRFNSHRWFTPHIWCMYDTLLTVALHTGWMHDVLLAIQDREDAWQVSHRITIESKAHFYNFLRQILNLRGTVIRKHHWSIW